MQMPDKIVLRAVESLIPYARNARTHSDAHVAQIAGSMREFTSAGGEFVGRLTANWGPIDGFRPANTGLEG